MLLVAIACLFISVGALYFAIDLTIEMIDSIRHQALLVIIPKGSFYMFGVGVGIFCLAFDLSIALVPKYKLTEKQVNIFKYIFFGSFIAMLTLPHLIHYPLAAKLERMGYAYCAEKSNYWFRSSDIAYVKDLRLCVSDD